MSFFSSRGSLIEIVGSERIQLDSKRNWKNFLKAIGRGFSQFGSNFWKHLKGALFAWMFGAFSNVGIELPKSFDIKSIFGFILQIFGLTYANIRAKLVKKLGQELLELPAGTLEPDLQPVLG